MDVLVSVLMTAFNREKYISEAIESVLASTYSNFELIILDDCSTDATVAIARNYELKDERVKVYVNNTNLGQFPNRNKIASLASGNYIKYFDSDDIMYDFCLQVMIDSMLQFPEAAAGSELQVNDGSIALPIQFLPRQAYINHFFYGNPLLFVGPSGSIIKKSAFDNAGGFDEHIGILADTLLMLKIAAVTPVVGIRKDLFYWRRHDEQVTIGQDDWLEMQQQRFEINSKAMNFASALFTNKELSILKRNLKNILMRNLFKRVLGKRNLHDAINVWSITDLNFFDSLLAILPNRRIAK